MVLCTKCGTPLADGNNFCGKCGMSIQAVPVAVASSTLVKLQYTTTADAVYKGDIVSKTASTVYEGGEEKYTDEDGNVYEGELEDDELNGEGKITYADGNVYEGEFEDGELNGKGKITFKDGEVWEGDFVDNRVNGKGKIITADGFVKEGNFVDSMLDGKGKITDEDGGLIEGDFIEGKLNGKGKFALAGDKYEGEFADGVPDGKGIYTYADGGVYNGEFSGGEKHGKGIYTFPDGDVWEGNFVNDKLNGKGIIDHADGSVMECNFVDGKITGGTLRSAEGNEDFVSATFTVAKDNEDTVEKIAEPETKPEPEDDFAIYDGTQTSAESDDDLIETADADDYDIVVNAANEIMIVMYVREGNPSSPQAYRTADKDILFKRSADELVLFDTLPDETFEYFTKVNTILVNEIDNDGKTVHCYDVHLSDQ